MYHHSVRYYYQECGGTTMSWKQELPLSQSQVSQFGSWYLNLFKIKESVSLNKTEQVSRASNSRSHGKCRCFRPSTTCCDSTHTGRLSRFFLLARQSRIPAQASHENSIEATDDKTFSGTFFQAEITTFDDGHSKERLQQTTSTTNQFVITHHDLQRMRDILWYQSSIISGQARKRTETSFQDPMSTNTLFGGKGDHGTSNAIFSNTMEDPIPKRYLGKG